MIDIVKTALHVAHSMKVGGMYTITHLVLLRKIHEYGIEILFHPNTFNCIKTIDFSDH